MAPGLNAHARRAAIAARINADREVDFTTLADEFDVSAMTIRRDIERSEGCLLEKYDAPHEQEGLK
ncbi:DeoR family transcriptional regulator [Mycolicibacterium porcinum]|uniref:DeoR family transcriptional regulator n=1 Tax=Mycolicibacterium porcinum TaxID=39693 RepID=UPI003F649B0A